VTLDPGLVWEAGSLRGAFLAPSAKSTDPAASARHAQATLCRIVDRPVTRTSMVEDRIMARFPPTRQL